MKQSIHRIALVFFVINLLAIGGSIVSGYHRGKLAYRFEEKQAMTYFSSNQLAGTALMAWATYLAHRKLLKRDPWKNRSVLFWLLSALGFSFLMMDESFQIHEGFDNFIAHAKGGHTDAGFDGLATLGYGVVAAGICYYFRAEFLRYRRCLVYYAIGGVFLVLTSVLDIGDESQLQIVIEESCKILGVVAFLMAYVGAFLGSLEEAASLMRSAPAEAAHESVHRAPEKIRRAAQG